MKYQIKMWLALATLALTGCGTGSTVQVESQGISPPSTEVAQDPGPIAQNIPFLAEPKPDSLRQADVNAGMSVCVHRHDGIYNSDSQAEVVSVGDVVSMIESTPSGGPTSIDITPQGYQLVEIAPQQWANAWLTAGTC